MLADDDVSAYSGKNRPGYRAMLEAIREREVDAVLVWHVDRLHRRPIELEEFVNACTEAGLSDLATVHGDLNLGNGDGLLIARLTPHGPCLVRPAAWTQRNRGLSLSMPRLARTTGTLGGDLRVLLRSAGPAGAQRGAPGGPAQR